MANVFRLILLCIPLLGAVAATAEVQRIDRWQTAGPMDAPLVQTNADLEDEKIAAASSLKAQAISEAMSLSNQDSVMVGASAGLPMCLALVFLVTLVRQRK